MRVKYWLNQVVNSNRILPSRGARRWYQKKSSHLTRNVSQTEFGSYEQLEDRRLLATMPFAYDTSAESNIGVVLHDAFGVSAEVAPDSMHAVAGSQSSVSPLASNVVVFVDAGVEDYQSLLEEMLGSDHSQAGFENVEFVILDSELDGVEQITDVLRGYRDISAVHVFSHGSAGSLQLGSTQLDAANLDDYSQQLSEWGASLADGADILLYGCNVAQGDWGIEFVESLAAVTGADIAASNDLTGTSTLGGDWVLEVSTGQVAADVIDSSNYQYTLETLNGVINRILATFSGTAPATTMVFNSGDAIGMSGDVVPTSVDIGQIPAGTKSDLQLDNITLTFPTNLNFDGTKWSGGVGVTAGQGILLPGVLDVGIIDDAFDNPRRVESAVNNGQQPNGKYEVVFTLAGDHRDLGETKLFPSKELAVLNSKPATFNDLDFSDANEILFTTVEYDDVNDTTTVTTEYNFDPGTNWTGGSLLAASDPDIDDDGDTVGVSGVIQLAPGNAGSILTFNALEAADIGFPRWLDVRIEGLQMEFPDFRVNDSDNFLKLNASLNGFETGNFFLNEAIRNNSLLQLNVEGTVSGLEFDMDKLAEGSISDGRIRLPKNPITDLSGISGSVSGKIFQLGSVSAGFIAKAVSIDATGAITTQESAIVDTYIYGAVRGSLAFGGTTVDDGMGGMQTKGAFDVGFNFAVSELGPLQMFVYSNVNIVIEPISGLAISELRGGVRFNANLENLQVRAPIGTVENEFSVDGFPDPNDASDVDYRVVLTTTGHNLKVGDEFKIIAAGNPAYLSGKDPFVVTAVDGDDITYVMEENPGAFTTADIRKISISDAFDLRDPGFSSTKDLSLSDWEAQLDQAVVNQATTGPEVVDGKVLAESLDGHSVIAGEVDIDDDGVITVNDDGTVFGRAVIDGKIDFDGFLPPASLWDVLFEKAVLEFGASLSFDPRISSDLLSFDADVLFDTEGRFLLTGSMNLLLDTISLPAKLYADFSDVSQGATRFLFLADLPEVPQNTSGVEPLLVLHAGVTFETLLGGVPATLDSLSGFPVGVGVDVLDATINDLSGTGAGPWDVTYMLDMPTTVPSASYSVGDSVVIVNSDPFTFDGTHIVRAIDDVNDTITVRIGTSVIDGKLDLDLDNNIDSDDDGIYQGIPVIDGALDLNKDGTIDSNDDGEIFTVITGGEVVGYPVIDGKVDVDEDGDVNDDAADDGVLTTFPVRIETNVIEGRLDIDRDNEIDADDVGLFSGFAVIDGELDINGNGAIDANDDRSITSVLGNTTVVYTVIDGRVDIDGDGDVNNDSDDDGTIGQDPLTLVTGGLAANADDLGDGFRISVEGGVDLNIPLVTTLTLEGSTMLDVTVGTGDVDLRLDLAFDVTLSETNVGAIGNANGAFHVTIDADLLVAAEGDGSIMLPKVEIWGAAILTTDFGFLEPIGLYADATGLLRINSTDDSTLEETLRDVDNNPIVVGLPADSFALRLDGNVDFRIQDASVFQIIGSFVLEFSPNGFNVALFSDNGSGIPQPASLRIGPTGSSLLEFQVLGFLAIRDEGFAADLVLTADASLPLDLATLEGRAVFIVNTTGEAIQFDIPGDGTDPNRPTGLSLTIPAAQPQNPSEILAGPGPDGQSGISLDDLITGNPSWTEGASGAYGVVFVEAKMALLSVLEFDLSGYILLSQTVASMEANFYAGGDFLGLASASVGGSVFFSSEGEFELDVEGDVQLGPDWININGGAEVLISYLDDNGKASGGNGPKELDISGSLDVGLTVDIDPFPAVDITLAALSVDYNSSTGSITVGVSYPEPFWDEACVDLGFLGEACVPYPNFRDATYTFVVGTLKVDAPPPIVLGQRDPATGVLTVNVGSEANRNTRNLLVDEINEDVTIGANSPVSNGVQTITLSMFGVTQVFPNVREIRIEDMSDGDDVVEILAAVSIPSEVHLGDGRDRLTNKGSGPVMAFGDAGADRLNGGSAVETLKGGSGKDVIEGGIGDTIEGGDDKDTLILELTGSNSEQVAVTPNGTNFTVTIGGASLNVDSVEILNIDNAEGRQESDTFTINDVSASVLGQINLNLGDDNLQDNVVINGSSGSETLDVSIAEVSRSSTDELVDILRVSKQGGVKVDIFDANATSGGDTVTLDTGGEADTVNIYSTLAGVPTTVAGGSGTDTFNVRSISAPLTINGGNDSDTINVGSTAPTLPGGNVDGIAALLTVNGEANGPGDTLNVDDSADDTAGMGTLTDSTITGLFGAGGSIAYGTIENLAILLGNGSDTFTIQSTHANASTLDTNGGDDTVYVRSTNGETNINTGAGADTINISSVAAVNAGDLDGIQGPVAVDVGTESNRLVLGDFDDVIGNSNVVVTSNQITGMAPSTISYSGDGVTDVKLIGSDSTTLPDIFDVESFGIDNTLVLAGNSGDDQVILRSNALGDAAIDGNTGRDEVIIELVGMGDRLVSVTGGDDDDLLRIEGTDSDDGFLLFDHEVRLVDEKIIYDTIEMLEVDGLAGADVFDVLNSAIPTTLFGGENDDLFQLASLAPELAGGSNLDGILGEMTIYGGAGQNTLRASDYGGSANDNVIVTSSQIWNFAPTTINYSSANGSSNSNLSGPGNAGGGLVSGTMLVELFGSNNGDDVFNVNSLDQENTLFINGFNGDDSMFVRADALGDVTLRGDADDDRFLVNLIGNSDRQVNIAGDEGLNVLTVVGTSGGDSLDVSEGNVSLGSEDVNFAEIGDLTVNGIQGDDTFNFHSTSAPITTLIGYEGMDKFFVFNTTGATTRLVVFGGSGDDTFELRAAAGGTWTKIYGQAGNDQFDLGSTEADNNGDLSKLSARVVVQGNGDEDVLNINDHGADGAYDYRVFPRWIVNQPGGLRDPASPEFSIWAWSNCDWREPISETILR